ncbi:hypothetical protein [Solibacillus sp. FSL K6-1523]|uniref:hypothetical protein n=1 Tax=Solibacillus sp. FSL K6-1523 TaxID=2921471 RepID=UPI0030F70096
MNEVICEIQDKPAVEQVHAFLNTLTVEQQREFLNIIQGAQITMRLMKKEREGEQIA